MLKNIPHFAFVTDAPELNPYNKKMHRAMTAYDGPPSDIKTVERRFAKNYPGADSIQVLSSVTEVPSKEAAIVVSSSKSSLALYTKSVCYAFRSVKSLPDVRTVVRHLECQLMNLALMTPNGQVHQEDVGQ